MTIEILPGGFNAVDYKGDVVPVDDVEPQFSEAAEEFELDYLIDVEDERLLEHALAEGVYSPNVRKRIESVILALRNTSPNKPCKKDSGGVPIGARLGRLEHLDQVDPGVVAILRARVAKHNKPFEVACRQNVGRVAIAPSFLGETQREPDWAERAAGQAVRRPDDDM